MFDLSIWVSSGAIFCEMTEMGRNRFVGGRGRHQERCGGRCEFEMLIRYLGGDGDVKEAVGSESGAGMRHRWDTYLDITSVWM